VAYKPAGAVRAPKLSPKFASYAPAPPPGLALEHQSLQFTVQSKLWVSGVNLRVALVGNIHKTDIREPLKLSLHIPWVFFDHLSKTTNMHPEIGILGVYNNNFSSGFGRYKKFKHVFLFNNWCC
jgi:hypothetical protein